jgi:predicted nucleic-acid-binding protein
MLAADANVLVRYLTGDDPRQTARAKALIQRGEIFVPTTVLLETEWVLRKGYKFDTTRIVQALRTLAGEPSITLEQPLAASTAMDWAEQGLDFADALHLAASAHCEGFASFDRQLAKRAGITGQQVRAP